MSSPSSPSTRSPPPARRKGSESSRDSEDSLRALEFSDGAAVPLRRIERSYSISGFNFQQDLLPLSLSEPERDVTVADGEKTLGIVNAIALIVGLQIGSGIFSSPGIVIANTRSVGASLLCWACSGLGAWAGASSMAELGAAIPLNGGAQAYLAYAYGPLPAYLFTWTAIVALKPGGNAVIALIFGEYLARLIFHARDPEAAPDALPTWAIKLTATSAIIIISLIGVAGRMLGPRVAVAFTAVKILVLVCCPVSWSLRYIDKSLKVLVTSLGIVQLARGRASTSFSAPVFEGSSTSPSAYALAVYSGLWAYDGWDQANYVAGELKNPGRNLPRAIHSSMFIVIILFLTANASYFIVLDKSIVALSNTVALDFGKAVFGTTGAIVFASMVAFSCFGALNGSLYTTARLIAVAAREGYLPALFGRLHSKLKTPVNAMILQAVWTIGFVVVGGGFRSLINFSVVTSWTFYFVTILAVVVLRFKEPNLDRPYRVWIATPLLFCAICLFLLTMPVIAAPLEALTALVFVLAGVPVYFLTQRRNRTTRSLSESRYFGWLGDFLSRFRTSRISDGWQAVPVEEERVEMTQR